MTTFMTMSMAMATVLAYAVDLRCTAVSFPDVFYFGCSRTAVAHREPRPTAGKPTRTDLGLRPPSISFIAWYFAYWSILSTGLEVEVLNQAVAPPKSHTFTRTVVYPRAYLHACMTACPQGSARRAPAPCGTKSEPGPSSTRTLSGTSTANRPPPTSSSSCGSRRTCTSPHLAGGTSRSTSRRTPGGQPARPRQPIWRRKR